MIPKQTTLKKPIEFEGIGLHTGKRVKTRIEPAEANTGYLIVDPEANFSVKANLDNVVETKRYIAIGSSERNFLVVEHLLSALYGMDVDNAVIKIWGDEPPSLDGSSLPYAQAIKQAGIQELSVEREYLKISDPVVVNQGTKKIILTHAQELNILYGIRYDTRKLSQVYSSVINPETYLNEIAPARTFVFLDEVKGLRSKGLAKGGSLENTLVLTEDGVLNQEGMRFWDEPVRHKVLDLIGDLALTGYRFRGEIEAFMTGHTVHVEFAKKIINRAKGFDITQILNVIPHRYPFILVDRILELSENYVLGVKNVTINEPFFQGHFPGHPVMPGVLIIEALAQTGGFLLLNKVEDREKKLIYFAGIENVKFRRPVRPGDRLYLEGELLRFSGRLAKLRARALVGSEVVTEVTMTATIVER